MANTLSNFQIYDVEFFGGLSETVQQSAIQMNEGSAGTIRMVSVNQKGEFERESFFSNVDGLVSRRDNTSIADIPDLDMAQGEFVSVKLNTKIGPVAKTLDAFKKIGEDPRLMSFSLGSMYGVDITLDYLNTGLLGARAAMESVGSGMVLDIAGSAEDNKKLSYEYLVRGLAKMGDRASRVRAWVMHSKTYYDLMEGAIADKVTNVADVAIYQATVGSLGRPVLVTDSPSLITAGTDPETDPDVYHVLGLTDDAIQINQSEDSTIYSEIVTGKESLLMRLQGETAHTIGIKGFEYVGGANPDDAELGAPASFSYSMGDVKSGPGFMINVH